MRAAVTPLLVMTRVFDAPRADVFAEWTDPERLARWWEHRIDGRRRVDNDRYHVAICDLRAPDRIVFTWGGERAETTTIITITFADDGARTRFTLEQGIMRTGWACAFDRLRDLLHAETGASP